jgi:hypothetical protein
MGTKKYQSIILILLILGLAAFFRLCQIDSMPPGLYPDEAINGNDALTTLQTNQWKVFYPENNGREGLFIWLLAWSFKIFGPAVWSLRLVSAIIGILTVLGLYCLTKQLFNTHIALLSSFFLAISFWHINFSRIGFRGILVPFCLVWSFYFLFKGLNAIRSWQLSSTSIIKAGQCAFWNARPTSGHGSVGEADGKRAEPASKFSSLGKIYVSRRHLPSLTTLYFILAGLFFGLGFYTYIAFRTAVLILGLVVLIEMWSYWRNNRPIGWTCSNLWHKIYLRDGWWRWDVMFLVIILAILPLGLYFYHHPHDFIGRATGISVFVAEHPWLELGQSTLKTLAMFNWQGDWNWRHNYAGSPMLAWPVGILFVLGLALVVIKTFSEIWQVFSGTLDRRAGTVPPSPSFLKKNWGWAESEEVSRVSQPRWGWRTIPENSLPNLAPQDSLPKPTYLFLLSWFIIMLLPAILTAEGIPHALRTIGVIPVVYIFTALGLSWLITQLKKISHIQFFPLKFRKTTAILAVLILILFLLQPALFNFNKYFSQWGQNPEVAGAFRQDLVDLGNYLNSLPENIQKYVIVNESGVPVPYPDGLPVRQAGLPMPVQTVMFIQRTANSEQRTIYLLPENIDQIQIDNQPTIIVSLQPNENLLHQLLQKWPGGKIEKENGFQVFKINK